MLRTLNKPYGFLGHLNARVLSTSSDLHVRNVHIAAFVLEPCQLEAPCICWALKRKELQNPVPKPPMNTDFRTAGCLRPRILDVGFN